DRNGGIVLRWGQGFFGRAHGSCVGPDGAFFCTDDRKHTVSKFTPDGGTILMTLGMKDKPSQTGYREGPQLFERIASITHGGPPFNRPTGVGISSTGDIYVADGYGNARVHRFNSKGDLISSWGEPGPGPSQFRLPHNLWVDKSGRVWVADRENSRIQIFREDGKFLTQWTDLIRPTDVCIHDDVVYVTELCRRVSIFTLEGELLSRWGNEGHAVEDPLFYAPHAVAVDSRGDLYVGEVSMTEAKVDRGGRALQKFTRKA
ncbi:MAG TPA: peptidyl-alpha-hydroxyglycine alpha-amidating lyase family protein, partial [Candidatus Acidoferrum sp.]|nr:peptidyl-alpha-hydroxyglycine alpha-amidating lyase family protein [Candidatus Acidoferrum sp.]